MFSVAVEVAAARYVSLQGTQNTVQSAAFISNHHHWLFQRIPDPDMRKQLLPRGYSRSVTPMEGETRSRSRVSLPIHRSIAKDFAKNGASAVFIGDSISGFVSYVGYASALCTYLPSPLPNGWLSENPACEPKAGSWRINKS